MESWAFQELQGAQLKDERQRTNIVKICEQVSQQPHRSFSACCGSALRKSGWGIFSAQKADLLRGHLQQTWRRCSGHEVLLCLSDSTELNYHGHKCTSGLGKLGSEHSVRGLGMHTVIAVDGQAENQFLGLLGQYIWAPIVEGRHCTDKKNYSLIPIEQKETYRWLMGIEWAYRLKSALKKCKDPALVLAVTDREGDFYDHIAHAKKRGVQVLVRVNHMRRKVCYRGQELRLIDLKTKLPVLGTYRYQINASEGRSPREAVMEVRVAKIKLKPSGVKQGKAFRLSVVFASEKNPPSAEQAIEWNLLCSLPLPEGSCQETYHVAYTWILYYEKRWIIERFHYTLKSGALQVERLQFDNFNRLKNALQLYSIIAWYMMSLLSVAKSEPQTPIETIADPNEVEILKALSSKEVTTAKQAVLAIASLAGFAPSKKQPLPGEKIFAQGMQTFLSIKTGFLLAKHQFYGTG